MEQFSILKEVASDSLRTNIIRLPSGAYLSAGAHQFRSLWTRDFCFAIPGLLAIDEGEAVRNHLERLIENRRMSDHLIPRILDSMNSSVRVVINSIFCRLLRGKSIQIKDPLKPEYLGEHKTVAIDSNLLVIIGCYQYYQNTGNERWWQEQQKNLSCLLSFYDDKKSHGLIVQEAFADWQDSASRTGARVLTNVLYGIVLKIFADLDDSYRDSYRTFAELIKQNFWDDQIGLFCDCPGGGTQAQVSLDVQLFVIVFDLLGEEFSSKLYKSLKRSDLWNESRLPGLCSNVNYPRSQVSWTTKVVGLSHYHGTMYWSWLMGFAATAAVKQADLNEAQRIFKELEVMAKRDGVIYEIFRNDEELSVFKNLVYHSEGPFSWGSGRILEALSHYQRECC